MLISLHGSACPATRCQASNHVSGRAAHDPYFEQRIERRAWLVRQVTVASTIRPVLQP